MMLSAANSRAMALASMASAVAVQIAASAITAVTRSRGAGCVPNAELSAVSTVSMPLYAFNPMVATSAATEASDKSTPKPVNTASPASCSATSPSAAPIRVASQAPSVISQMAEAEAPQYTAAMIGARRRAAGQIP